MGMQVVEDGRGGGGNVGEGEFFLLLGRGWWWCCCRGVWMMREVRRRMEMAGLNALVVVTDLVFVGRLMEDAGAGVEERYGHAGIAEYEDSSICVISR